MSTEKTRKLSFYKQTKCFLHMCFIPATCIILIYKALSYLLFQPLLRLIWNIGLHFAPVNYITSTNLRDLYHSPSIIAALLLIGILIGFWCLFGMTIMIQCLDFCKREVSFNGRKIFKAAFLSMHHVLLPRNWPMLVFCAFVIPFSNVAMMSNLISSITLPEYIMESIDDSLTLSSIFTIFSLLALYLVIRLLFCVHYFVLEHQSFKDAARSSFSLQKGHIFRDFIRLIIWKIRVAIKYGLYFILFYLVIFVLYGLLSQRSSQTMVAFYGVSNIVMKPFFSYLMDSILSLSQIAFISFLYYYYLSDGLFASQLQNIREKRSIYGSRKPFFVMLASMTALIILLTAVLSILPVTQTLLSYYMDNQAEITAHRGYSAVAPENTLPAFQAAIDSGIVDYAELDVQLTKDGVVMLTHDTNLSRCTGMNANIYDLTYEEVRSLDAGSFFSSEFAGTQIPTLDEVIKLCKGKIKLNIEIKSNSHTPELEAKTVQIIEDNHFEQECVITSLSYESLCKVKQANPDLRTGLILAIGVGNFYDLENVDFFSVESTFVTQRVVNELHLRNKEIHVWTVDTTENAEKMADRGVDNIITGDPPLIHSVLTEHEDSLQSLFDLFLNSDELEQLKIQAPSS